MPARIAGARHHKRAHVGRQLQHPFKRTPAVLHAKHIVNLQMRGHPGRESRLLDAVLHIIGHGLRRHFEDRRLVHVVPEPRHSLAHKVAVQRAPPVARRLLREVGKHRLARPHHAHIMSIRPGSSQSGRPPCLRHTACSRRWAKSAMCRSVMTTVRMCCAFRSWIIWSKCGNRSGSTVKGRFFN